MADTLFQIDLVTPERVLLSGMSSEVVLRTGEGDLTFLAGHTRLVGTVQPGVVRVVTADGEERRAAVHGGFTQVEHGVPLAAAGDGAEGDELTTGTRVTLLVGVAELAEEIDVDRARAAEQVATARIAELAGPSGRSPVEGEEPDAELAAAEAALLRARTRLEAVEATTPATA